jgi:hypothetical protein
VHIYINISTESNDTNNNEAKQYSLDIIKSATMNFSDENRLGEGGFGAVYKVLYPYISNFTP